MIGRHHIRVSNQKVQFSFELVRNITVIRGDSATGKTTLIGLLSDFEALGRQSGVSVKCDKPCRVLTEIDWMLRLENIRDSIVFIDEGNRFIRSVEFARAVRESDNYYVLITRENLHNLPYSVEEIYEMYPYRHSMKLGRVYNGTRRFYSDMPSTSFNITNTDILITEDSNSGHEFFLHVAEANGIHCISAHGKSRIFETLGSIDQRVIVIADGAAFGCEIDRIHKLQATNPGRITLYLPESFEWLILKSDILRMQDIREILEAPENRIDSSVYFSWEQYFTELLSDRTEDTYMQYTKAHLAPFYLQNENVRRILEEIGL
ncbi:MAG: hypothetical protein E7665_02575 [Ruminococcaceae bacterium]|nr:hypothetical protein [Oscillospiraceae bacterium]